MMKVAKKNKFFKKIAGLILVFIWGTPAMAQVSSILDIRPEYGNYSFSYNDVPENIVSIATPITGYTFQWEMSAMPLSGFTDITSATLENYSFSAPLTQTTYFRRKAIKAGASFYSNTVKYELVSANWENINYVREHDVLIAGQSDWKLIDQLPIGSKLETTTYTDGLGRSLQKISRETATAPEGAAPETVWGDMVQFSAYDVYGRQVKQYLPYTSTTATGKYKTNAATQQALYYSNVYDETAAYSSITYDNSPLNRTLLVKAPGTSWAAGSGNSMNYELNTANENVRYFTIGYTAGAQPVTAATWPANSLYKSKSVDENGNQVIEYINSLGQSILTKTQVDASPTAEHSGWINVYSVYDDFGLLRYRLQPEAVKWLESNGWSFAASNGQQVLDDLCFRYEYDEKGRMISKKAPGAEELRMIYDVRDRLVMMQDGNQRAKSPAEWTVNIYDVLDRVVLTTLYRTNSSILDLQTTINSTTTSTLVLAQTISVGTDIVVTERNPAVLAYNASSSIEFAADFETENIDDFTGEIIPGGSSTNIEITFTDINSPIPAATLSNPAVCTILKYLYYDDYSFEEAAVFSANHQNHQAYSSGAEAIGWSKRTVGMLTGSRVRVLGTDRFLGNTLFYDEKGRPVQGHEENYKGGTDISTTQYNFDGRVMSAHTRHSTANTGYGSFDVITKYLYDKIGRVNGIEKKYGSNPFKAIGAYSFDDMGRLLKKRLSPGYTGTGKTELEVLAYSYNLHNNITGINKDYALKTNGVYNKWDHFFGLYLGYDNRDGVFANAELNGQVTGLLWNTQGDDAQRKYDFTYDRAGRLINADFNEKQKTADSWSHTEMDFSVSGTTGAISYDLNGNLISMIQKGVLPGNSTPVNVDDLAYTYAARTNRLLKVIDNGTAATANGKLGDFTDGSNGAADDYVYDNNGNLVIDLNKQVKDLAGQTGGEGIKYNFLDKPEEIRISGKGVIKIVYDADGNKLQRIFTPEGGGTVKTLSYVNEYVYEGDELQYINFEEGRIRVMTMIDENNGFDFLSLDGNMDLPGGSRGAYDFFIRDYQGNVRMILTEQTHTGSNACTMETNRAANEEPLFGKVDAGGVPTSDNEVKARFPVSSIPNQGTGGGWNHGSIGNHVIRVGNQAGSKVGPNTLLKVMAGDQVSATTIYYYQNTVTNTAGSNNLLNSVISSLTNAISGNAANPLIKGAAGDITSPFMGNIPFSDATGPDAANPAGTNPKAYLTILFFDERFNFVEEGSTSLRVTTAGNGADPLVLENIKAPKNGYAYIYVSNEADEHVYFDNLQVSHTRGRIIEENHYYAFGLRIAGISSKKLGDIAEGSLKNDYLYNDKELWDDADLNWYDYGFRNYDPQIGRFPQLDPLTDSYPYYTPYQYAGNEPIANVDLDGLEPYKVLEGVTVRAALKSTPTALSVSGNFLKGIGLSLWGTVKGLANAVTNPVNTVKGLTHVVTHPVETANALLSAGKTAYNAFKEGDANVKAKMLGELTGEIGQIFVGTGALKIASKTVSVSGDISKLTKFSEATTANTKIARSVGADINKVDKVLQSGGQALKPKTLKALNLTKEQGRNAIHGLKSELGLPNNFHGKIMGNGDYLHPSTGKWLGNLHDYVY